VSVCRTEDECVEEAMLESYIDDFLMDDVDFAGIEYMEFWVAEKDFYFRTLKSVHLQTGELHFFLYIKEVWNGNVSVELDLDHSPVFPSIEWKIHYT
jgi:hypothetical protein